MSLLTIVFQQSDLATTTKTRSVTFSNARKVHLENVTEIDKGVSEQGAEKSSQKDC